MPSGAKKRKAAKKKKVNNSNNSTLSSTTTTESHYGESHGGELSSPASQEHQDHRHQFTEGEDVEVEKREDDSSDHKSITIGETESAAKEEIGDGQTNGMSKSEKSKDSSSSSGSSSDSDDEPHAVEKDVVVVDAVPVVESSQPIETMPEKIMHKIDAIAVIIVDPVKPDDSLAEVESEVDDVTKMEEKIDLVEETSLSAGLDKSSLVEQKVLGSDSSSKDNVSTSDVVVESVLRENHVTQLPSLDEKVSLESKDHVEASVHPKGAFSGANGTGHEIESEKILVSEGALKDNCSTSDVVVVSGMKEHEVTQLPSLEEKDSSESKDHAAASSHSSKSVSGVNSTGHATESETPEYSERQPLVDSFPRAVQTKSWKSCCGLLELFSGSDR